MSALGSVTMAASRRDRALRRLDLSARPAMIDPQHRAVERDRHIRGMRDDGRSVSLDHAPVDAAVVVAVEIVHRHPVELGAVDIGATASISAVPAVAGLEEGRRG